MVREWGEAVDADLAHQERDKADVGVAFVGLYSELLGQQGLDEVSGEFAVEEGEMVPALAHDGVLVRAGANLFEACKGVGIHCLLIL